MRGFAFVMICLLGSPALRAGVVTYPAPSGETLSQVYQVWADGQKVDVYMARVLDPPFAGKQWDYGGPYGFANFDVAGEVGVKISSTRSLKNVVVRPKHADVQVRHQGDHTVLIKLLGPTKVSIEPDGKRGPLLLFANPMEKDRPRPDAPGVRYFGPGIHDVGKIVVESNETLYLSGGAVVKGGVIAEGSNIRITGRGILDGSDSRWREGPTPHLISIRGTDVDIKDIRMHGEGQRELMRLRPVVNQYMRKKVPGQIRDVRIRNLTLAGGPGDYLIQLQGADAQHAVGGVTFDNVTILDTRFTEDSARLIVGEHVRDLRFGTAAK